MGSVPDGIVYLAIGGDLFDAGSTVAYWNGHCQFDDGSQYENGPDFTDAGDAVTWWRERGAKRIYIRLDFEETQWAGEGAPPGDSRTITIFDFADPRGRPEGARETVAAMRRALAEEEESEHAARALEEGRRLTERRESVDLSIEELAIRIGVSPEWLADVEAGTSTYEVTFAQWINLVWATRKGWPDEMHPMRTGASGWATLQGQFLREAEICVNNMLGLYD